MKRPLRPIWVNQMLHLRDICVSYGEVQALWDINIDVQAGELVAVIGSNASGKTTTLKAISGIVPIQKGSITLREGTDAGSTETDLSSLKPHEIVAKGIAHVPEGRRLFPQLSVYENLIMGSLTPTAKLKRKEQLEKVMGLFPIVRERRDQLAGTLSGGEQQMVAIARGLMACPRILMLDEPSLGLAPKIVQAVFETIKEIKQMGVTILLVEQNTQLALKLADRAFVLENGRVVMKGSGEELLVNPHVRSAYLGL